MMIMMVMMVMLVIMVMMITMALRYGPSLFQVTKKVLLSSPSFPSSSFCPLHPGVVRFSQMVSNGLGFSLVKSLRFGLIFRPLQTLVTSEADLKS